ncbi:hypothetical protein [Gordonia sp. (in: high G+C Gram-positive bacteria)]|uniref:hypothetical protein n=1 Tax=Gordonia sp. (in: high G+C Gram-positive bacteria) TaxID=84139 RepID=UPI003C7653FD
MTGRATRISGVVLAAATVAVLGAGCSGSDTAAPADALHPTNVVLSQDDLPGNLKTVKLDKDTLRQLADQLHDATKKTTVTPANCAGIGSMPDSINPKADGLMAARNDAVSVSEAVEVAAIVPGGVDLAAAKARVTGACSTVKVAVSSGPIKDAVITIDNTVLNVAQGAAEQVLVVESASRTVRGSKAASEKLLVGRAVVKGYAITVQMSSLTNSGDLDRQLFNEVFANAIAKAARP